METTPIRITCTFIATLTTFNFFLVAIRMYLRTDREVLPGYVVPDDMPTPRKKHVFTPTKEERESIISSLLSDPEP